MKKVQILMSTYNGSKYIKEQLESILNQKKVDIHILIRDDGSKDDTEKIINDYKSDKITFIKGNNLGCTKSFFELIQKSDEYDYYAFADQDDVWYEYKIYNAIKKLEKYDDIPAIYSSNTNFVDGNGKFLKQEKKNSEISLASAIMKNYVTGCTMVINNTLCKKLKNNLNVNVFCHDWWINLVTLSIGGISIFDENAYIDYRQHSNNVVGAEISFFSKWKKRYKKFFGKPYNRNEIASQLLSIYIDDISAENIKILELFKNYKSNKLSMIFNKNLKTNNFIDDVLFRICIIFNKI